jgi:uncharacterized protein YdaU (DUF1376 family)
MHYYQHHIGDFIRDTANLTDSQVMAYLRLIWMYYDSEKPLPNNAKVLAFKIGSTEETVSLILEAFFTQEDDAWKHSRCEAELAEYNVIRERNIANGKNGGRPKKTQSKPSGFPLETQKEPKNTGFSGEKTGPEASDTELEPIGSPVGTQPKPSGFPAGFQSEPSRNPNQEPVTSNQEKKKTTSSKKAPAGFEEFWLAYPNKSAKANAEKAFAKIGPDQDLLDRIMSGLTAAKRSRDWVKDGGQYIPHAATWLNGERWLDEYTPASRSSVDEDVFAGCI